MPLKKKSGHRQVYGRETWGQAWLIGVFGGKSICCLSQDFILEAACREAEHVLCDRRYFMLDDELFKAFETALKVPLTDNKAVQKLLAGKAQWED